jgi:hypothetical protein
MKAAVCHEFGNPLVIEEVNLRDSGEKGRVGLAISYLCFVRLESTYSGNMLTLGGGNFVTHMS